MPDRHAVGARSDPEYPLTLLYRFAWGIARMVSPLLAAGDSKLARGMAGRRRAHELLAMWGGTLRDPERPVVWFHAPSVGEGLQARAVIRELRSMRPELQVMYTFFSPSAERLARELEADVAAYLPWDLPGPLRTVLESCRPDAVVFTKTEVWPTLVREAGRLGIPVAMVAGTVPEGAGRSRPLARRLLASSWNALSVACANSPADGDALHGLGVPSDRIHVVGDPGIDAAAARFDARDPQAAWLAPFRARPMPTVVAGSTWGADEDVLLPALRTVRDAVPDLRAVLAPHEPSDHVVRALVQRLEADGWRATTLAEFEAGEGARAPDAIVVERVGVLAELYEAAAVSYVGGGFHAKGLHSVLEPAAAGSPVVFGPRHRNARAAGELVREGGAKVAGDPQTLAGVITSWLTDENLRLDAGSAATGYIDRHRGAAVRTAALVDTLLPTNR